MQRIDEVNFSDLTALGPTLHKYRGKGLFVHFSQQNKRLGVNPKAHHMDPKGVYFYPVDWLLDNNAKFERMDQWATNWPFFFICAIDRSGPGLDLDTVTADQLANLARQNGWAEFEKHDYFTPPATNQQALAKQAWGYLKMLNQSTMKWSKSIRGMGYVNDTRGIIMPYEPSQICVMDPRILRLVESGRQTELNTEKQNQWVYWSRVVVEAFKRMSEKHGGNVVWKNKRPTLVIEGKDWSYRVTFDEGWGDSRLVIETEMGRAKDRHTLSTTDMHKMNVEQIDERLELYLNGCKSFDGTELAFKPHMSMEEVETFLKSRFNADAQPQDIDWEISNGSGVMWATVSSTAGMPPVLTDIKIGVDDKSAWITLNLKINGNYVSNFNSAPLEEFDEYVMSRMDNMSNVKEEFEEEKLWEEFLGWISEYSGLTALEPYSDKFYNSRRKSELYGLIQTHFRRVGW